MSTLIAVYDSAGVCIGRCDAKCHDAHDPKCDCVCGGSNHGVGRATALANTRRHHKAWLTMFADSRGLDRAELDELVGADVVQEVLFA